MDLFTFVLIVSSIWFGLRFPAAAQALEVPPTNSSATLYRQSALGFFLVGAALFLTASLVDTLAHARDIGEVFGWCAVGCAHVSLKCGLRYSEVNRRRADEGWYEP